MPKPLSIVSFLWRDPHYGGPAYGPEHVRAWARMIDAHLTIPHETVIITDQPDLDYGTCRVVPLWDFNLDLPMWHAHGPNCYRRLKLFDRDTALACHLDRWAWIDLDMVIFDSLDPLFDVDDEFRVIERPYTEFSPDAKFGWPQGGMVYNAFAGCRQHVWDWFSADLDGFARASLKFIGNDQAVLQLTLSHDEKTWTMADGIYLLHADIPEVKVRGPERPNKSGTRMRKGKKFSTWPLPSGARIIFAHGFGKPWAVPGDVRSDDIDTKFPWFRPAWITYADTRN